MVTLRRAACGVFALALVLAVADCSCSGSSAGPCAGSSPLDGCGNTCRSSTACPPGLYCGLDGTCTADCDSNGDCGSGFYCNEIGRCRIDTGSGRDANIDAPRVDGSDICASVSLDARTVTPTVVLIVDQSGSMTSDFGGSGSRWDVLRDSLLARPDGLIFDLQSIVRFGLALYSARSDDMGHAVGMCPLITWVDPALDNYPAIRRVYEPASPIDDTPTGNAIDDVLDRVTGVPDPDPDPTIFILATDGEPDRCSELDPQRGQARAVAAARRAYDAGIRTFIISVGEGVVSASHLQDMANAGTGVGPGDPDAPYWVVGDDAGLRDALRTIVGGTLSCLVELDGRIDPDMACTGTVRLNGRVIPCDDPDGWRVVDESHIELQGAACDELTSGSGSTLTAEFPCDVVII